MNGKRRDDMGHYDDDGNFVTGSLWIAALMAGVVAGISTFGLMIIANYVIHYGFGGWWYQDNLQSLLACGIPTFIFLWMKWFFTYSTG
jgi:hypothetical protein